MDDSNQNLPGSWQPATTSLTKFGLNGARLEALTMAAKRLFSQFRTDATVEPKTYIVAVIAVFEHFPDDVVMAVTHPFTGMASKQNWLPTIHEIRLACDKANAPPPPDAVAETLARRRQDMVRAPAETRKEHVERLRREGKLTFSGDPLKKPTGSWWDRITPQHAADTLQRYEREARQNQIIDEELL